MITLFERRPGRVFCVNVIHPDSGEYITYGYIDGTRKLLAHKLFELARELPWWDTCVGIETIWQSQRCTVLRLWWEMVWRIIVCRPIYNAKWNWLNRKRIASDVAARRIRSAAYRQAQRDLARIGVCTGWLL